MRKMRRGNWVIVLSLLLAILLTILPLPTWASWGRPLWVLMVLCYWAMALEDSVSVGIAWLIGILLDVLGGTVFGEHALVMCLCVFIFIKLKKQIRLFPLLQQAIVILLLSVLYQSIIYLIQGILGSLPQTVFYWLPIITTPLFWPWVFVILRDSRRRFKVV